MGFRTFMYRFIPTRTDRGYGSGNDAFMGAGGLPVYLMRGPGFIPYDKLRVLQNPQTYYPRVLVPTDGYGGVQAGQIIFQPLEDDTTGAVSGL